MQKASTFRKIKVKKRGNALGFWFFRISLHLFGLKGAYGLLYFVCFHYLLFDRTAVRSALAYISKRFPNEEFLKRRLRIYRLFVSQGKQLIDRYAAISGREVFDIQLRGYSQLKKILSDSKQGMILLTAHVGNWQIVMTVLKKLDRKVYLLMRPEDNQAASRALHISDAQEYIKIISPEQYLGGILEVMKALREGNIVAIMGDRKYEFQAFDVSFLGRTAWFPYSAFSIAAAAGCPIVALLSAKLSTHGYKADVSNVFKPCYEKGIDKQVQLKAWVQEFALLLEDYVKQYPYQCFLFHDVWKEN